jgi:endonuclease/exonuclease/phosphatase family metal-dependent hydrolase
VPARVRILSYNVRSLRDDPHAVAAVIRACAPDVACIQEAPRFFRWRTKCAELAGEAGLFVVTGGRPAGAMLLLASLRPRVVAAHDILLTKQRGLHQRGLALATFAVGGTRFAVASLHLDLDAGQREVHAGEVLAQAALCGLPTILAGDVNEEPVGAAWRLLASRHVDAYAAAPNGGEHTYSATNPVKRIDGIFVQPPISVVECGVPEVEGIERASDHRPVLAVVDVPDTSDDGAVV